MLQKELVKANAEKNEREAAQHTEIEEWKTKAAAKHGKYPREVEDLQEQLAKADTDMKEGKTAHHEVIEFWENEVEVREEEYMPPP